MTREKIHNILVNATDFIFKDGEIESCSTNIDLLAHNLYIEVNKHEADLLKEFVEWLKGQNCIIMQQDCAGTMKCDFALEKFLEERK